MVRYPFRFDPRYEGLLRLVGINPLTAWVDVGEGLLFARFGAWSVATSLENVIGAQVSGPYRAYRAIGPHLSLKDRGLTFGTNAASGVCIRFARPVRGLDPLGLLRHPGLTVTVQEPEALAAAVLPPSGN